MNPWKSNDLITRQVIEIVIPFLTSCEWKFYYQQERAKDQSHLIRIRYKDEFGSSFMDYSSDMIWNEYQRLQREPNINSTS